MGQGMPMPQRLAAIAAHAIGIAVLVIDANIPAVALPTISRALAVGDGVVTGVITIYQLTMVMALLPLANLGDRIGHRRMFCCGLLLVAVASVLTLLADSFSLLLLLRSIQGLGAGMAMSVSIALLRAIYPDARLGSGLGFNSVVVASCSALAPVLGGFILAHYEWRFVFVAIVPLVMVSLALARWLPRTPKVDEKIDWHGAMLSAAMMGALVGGLQLATHGQWRVVGAGLIAAAVALAIFLVRSERRLARPVVPVDLLAMPAVGLSALATIAGFCASAMLIVSLPFRLEQVMGFSPEEVGLLLVPFALTMLVFAPLSGWLSDRVSPTWLSAPGMAVALLGLALVAWIPADASHLAIVWRLMLCAVGFGLFFAPNTRLIVASVPRDRSASVGGMLSTSRLLGQSIGAALVGLLLAMGIGLGPAQQWLAMTLALFAGLCIVMRQAKAPARG